MYKNIVKPFLDFLFAIILLIVLAIPMLIITICLRLETPKSKAIFRQTRIGKNSKEFTLYKFRSMVDTAPNSARLESEHKYLTKIGSIIRRFSLDELPQLFNILKGEMSFIGPRPVQPFEKETIVGRKKNQADKVTPGLTGLAQIRDRRVDSLKLRVENDGKYSKNIGFFMDLSIIFSTLHILHRGVLE